VWNHCLERISDVVPKYSYNTWILPLRAVSLEEQDKQVLNLEVPNVFHQKWVEENYIDIVRQCVCTVLGPTAALHLLLPATDASDTGERIAERQALVDSALFANLALEPHETDIGAFQAGGDVVQAVRRLAFGSRPIRREAHRKIPLLDGSQRLQQIDHKIPVIEASVSLANPGAGCPRFGSLGYSTVPATAI
jgi:hypothetical protein